RGDVGARGERLRPRAGEDDRADVVGPADVAERAGEVAERRGVERVQRLRPIDRDRRDAVGALEANPARCRVRHRQYSGWNSKRWCASMKRTVRDADRITTEFVIAPPFT